MKLFSKSDFLNESREYTIIDGTEYMKILGDQNYDIIPEFFRYNSQQSKFLLLDKIDYRTPKGSDLKLIRYIDQQNPNFPSRFKSIFARTHNKNEDYSIIPLRDTLIVFCPYYDFNMTRVNKDHIEFNNIEQPTYDNSLTLLYDDFYNDYKIIGQDDDILSKTFKKFTPLENETGKEYTDRISDLTLWGFYTKMSQDVTKEDINTKYPREVWFSGPCILRKLNP